MKKLVEIGTSLGPMLLAELGVKSDKIVYNPRPATLSVFQYTGASEEEKARAFRFRKMLSDLSPDMYQAYLVRPTNEQHQELDISDKEIDANLGPILRRYGFNLEEFDTPETCQIGQNEIYPATRTKPEGLIVVDVNFTDQNRFQGFQMTLETVLHGKRLNPGLKPYCFPIVGKQQSVGTAYVAPLSDWKAEAFKATNGALSGRVEQAYRGLAKAASINAGLDRCHVVCFERSDDDTGTLRPQPASRLSCQVPAYIRNSDPLVLVEGDTVVAALPHDKDNRIIAATIAVGDLHTGMSREKNQFLPDLSELVAYAAQDCSRQQYVS